MNECLSGVSTRPTIKEKNSEFFSYFLRAYLSLFYTCRLNFCLVFIFRSMQAGIVSTVFSLVLLTPAKNLSAVSLTPVNNFWLCC